MTGRPVNIAIIGTGFIAETRARAYGGVTGYEPRLVAAVSLSQAHADAYGRRHGITDTYADYARVLERPDVDVVDLCVPNYLHRPMTEAAAQAGKHVICSKPLTAFDGSALGPDREPSGVPRAEMLEAAAENAAAMVEATSESLIEKLETSAGWSPPAPDEDWAQGHRQMMQDFVASVADGKPPQSDGALGLDAIRVVYSAYLSAEQGRRVELSAG